MPQIRTIRLKAPTSDLYVSWARFAERHPQASFFQSEAFVRLIETWPEAEGVLVVALDGSGNITGSLLGVLICETPGRLWQKSRLKRIHRKLTSRAVVYGGPLLGQDPRQQQPTLRALLLALHREVKHRALFTQFRNFFDLSGFRTVFEGEGYRYNDRLNLLPGTSSAETAWKGITSNRRRQVRKSLEAGAVVVTEPSARQVDEFYAILRTLYARKVKKPLPSPTFFHALHALGPGPANNHPPPGTGSGYAKLLLVIYENRVAGGAACVMLPGRAMHEWYGCGLDREYKKAGIYPSVLATWASIEYAAKNGIPVFDFMGMGRPEIPYGVREFKKEFGGSWVNFGRFSRVNRAVPYFITETAYNGFLFLSRLVNYK